MKKKGSITTIKNIFKVHPFVYIFAIIVILIGAYKDFIILSVLIIIHELGHFLCAKFFKIETDKIIIYPLGGISKFYMDISEKPHIECLILLMGPIFQNIAYIFLLLIIKDRYLVNAYHLKILCFNLLPIYPLDGGKLLNVLLNHFFSYKKSFKLSVLFSYLITIFFLFTRLRITLNLILTYIVLICLIRREETKENMYYHKLLLERLLKDYNYKNTKIIKDKNHFYRYRKNILFTKERIYDEKEYLREKYHIFNKNC